jgi:hypothetical protein
MPNPDPIIHGLAAGVVRGRPFPLMPSNPECDHPERALTVRVTSNNARQYRFQCLACGARSDNISHGSLTAAERSGARPFDPEIRGNPAMRQAGIRRPIGWQIVHRDDDDPPPGMFTFEVYSYDFVIRWFNNAEDRYEWRLLPIWPGDIEEPVFKQ